MKAFNKIFAAIIAIIILIFIGTNMALAFYDNNESGRRYRVEINRIAPEIEQSGFAGADISGCEYVMRIEKYGADFYDTDSDHAVREINGELYRFDYNTENNSDKTKIIITVNLILFVMAILIFAVMLYIKIKILAPFERLTDVPYELSKGSLTAPLKENKKRFFGKFIWGIDMLRENIERQKKRELDLQRDKKCCFYRLPTI